MTHQELESHLLEILKKGNFAQPRFEARLILQEALQLNTTYLVLKSQDPVGDQKRALCEDWARERVRGVPLAYLSGHKGFYKHDFLVTPGVLVPRPETEFVIEAALRRKSRAEQIADFGTGTGCLGISLALEHPNAKVYLVDASPTACALAEKNADRLGVKTRVQVAHQTVESWVSPEPLDLVVANPPYIANGDPNVEPHVHQHEPGLALYSGATGLEALRSWSAAAYASLKKSGVLVLEFGAGQTQAVQDILKTSRFENIEIDKDLAGIERVASATK